MDGDTLTVSSGTSFNITDPSGATAATGTLTYGSSTTAAAMAQSIQAALNQLGDGNTYTVAAGSTTGSTTSFNITTSSGALPSLAVANAS